MKTMSSYDIKCKNIEEELRSVWPEWHVANHLGSGAFGDVFKIYKDNLGIRAESALKVIQVSDEMSSVVLLMNRQAVSQSNPPNALRNEIQIMESLRGAPNIVAMEDFFLKKEESSSTLFVRMELLTSLLEVLKGQYRHQILSSIREIRKLGMDICRALIYCEKKGIVHRDIKPANLFIDKFGDYKVGDFGASKRMDAVYAAQTMTSIGTISYMAPEIFQGHAYNNTVDIYALGLVLYQLLNSGRMPFLPTEGSYTSQDIDRANYKRMQGTPISSLVGKTVGGEVIDSRLDAVVRKACAVDPLDRYQTAREFYDALAISEKIERPNVDSGKKQHNSLKPGRVVHNQQKERPSGGIKLLMVIVPLLIIVASSIAVMTIRGDSAGPSTSASTSVAAQTENEDDGVLEKSDAVDETSSDAKVKDTADTANDSEADSGSSVSISGVIEKNENDNIIIISDPVLKKEIQNELGIGNREITEDDTKNLKKLICHDTVNDLTGLSVFSELETFSANYLGGGISDLSPLSGLTKLTKLDLSGNQISDVSPISGLTHLTRLELEMNQISDISPLAGLTKLTHLNLNQNQISDMSSIYGLTMLTELNIGSNQIKDISPLAGLTHLITLSLNDNEISDINLLSGMIHLKELDISYNNITDVSPLANLTDLTKLHLQGNQMNDLSSLSGLTKLVDTDFVINNTEDSITGVKDIETPFYGIWFSATKDVDGAIYIADRAKMQGLDARVVITTDWDNLNSEKWYVVTAGIYSDENDAKIALKEVLQYYPEAYIKYSGAKKTK